MRKDRGKALVALGVSLGIACLCGVLLYGTTGFIYAIADDVIMRDIASGAFTGTPDGHLIFVRYVLGFLLSRLYLVNDAIDWYGFFMAGCLLLALAVILYRGLAMKRGRIWKATYTGLALGLFGIGLLSHAAQFEWTISAAALGSAAFYLYVTLEGKKTRQLWDSLLIWFLLLLTFCIRYDVFFMIMPGFGIVFLWRFVRKKERGSFHFRFGEIFLPILVFASVGVVTLIESQAYSKEDWKEFKRFQNARSEVYDYSGVPSYEANPGFFEELGLDEHEVRNLRHYALYLVEDLDADMMEALREEAVRQASEEMGGRKRVKAGLALSFKQLVSPEYMSVSLPALLFFIGILMLALGRQKKGAVIPLLLFLGAEGVLWLILGFAGRLPERVAFSLHLTMMLGMAAYFVRLWSEKEEEDEQGKRTLWKRGAVLAAMLLCLGGAAFRLQKTIVWNQEKRAMDDSYQQFKTECRKEAGKLYFIETYMAEPVGGASVLVHGSSGINRCLTLGDWYTTSPLDEERMRALGIENVEETILKNPNAYLVVRDLEDPGFLGSYFSGKYPGTELVCQEVRSVGGRSYYLYQPEKTEGEQ